MELPAALKSAVERLLEHQPLDPLMKAAERLSNRYRREVRDGQLHLSDELTAKAYLAARLPATFAAVRAALDAVAEVHDAFSPKRQIDVGAGPGTALWAAADCWPGLQSATMLEASPAIRKVGETLSGALSLTCDWRAEDILGDLPRMEKADLVTLAYVLDELAENRIAEVTRKLFELTTDTIVIIEPGTPAGWKRILTVRQTLLEAGATLIAPCPHQAACPIVSPDWCHFSRRVARSRIHRQVKQADVPWEDEKYIFVAATRQPITRSGARVLSPPRMSGGVGRLKLCLSDGTAQETVISRRDGDAFRQARRADWGDLLHLSQD